MSIAKPSKVLVPVDLSQASLAAISVAVEMAGSPENVHVLYVSPKPQTEADYLREALTHHTREKVLEELRAKLAGLGYGTMKAQVAEGIPGDEITAAASDIGAELIVIPSHSRTGIPRLFLGSVANHVLRSAQCPVLVLRRQ